MIQIFSILEKYEFPKKLFFRYLQNIWDNLDGQKIPAFVLKDSTLCNALNVLKPPPLVRTHTFLAEPLPLTVYYI